MPPERVPGTVTLPSADLDPRKHFLTASVERFTDRSAFRVRTSHELVARANPSREVVLTVHGFNNRMADGIFRTAQMIADFEIDGPTFHYAWPSRGQPLGYAADRDAVLLARRGLEEMLDDLVRAGARSVVIVAHSMGSQLTMEVLRQMALRENPTLARVGGVVLMSPDIDPEVFKAQAEDIGTLPDPFVVFVSQRDPALRLSARLTGHDARLGNLASLASLETLGYQEIIIIDLTEARDAASRHLAAASSPAVISFLRQTEAVRAGLRTDQAGRAGAIPGTVLLAQEAMTVLLAPAQLLNP